MAAVRAGARQLIFIGGEPGAGKSRLAAEIAAATHRAGAVVLLGTCSPESHGPYQPFAECLEHLLGGTEASVLASCLPDSAAELLRLTPLVWRHRPGLAAPDGNDRDYRRELFDALTGLLHAVGEQRPVVCVLEDLHWAGQPTLQLLDHVVQHSAASRLLLLCTHRSTAPDRSDDLTYAIADLYRLDGVRRLDLAGLSAEEVAQYLVAEGGLGARRAREYAAVLRDQTGGNPFFLRELWRDMTRPGRPGLAPVRASVPGLPVSVRDTLQRRLSRLTRGRARRGGDRSGAGRRRGRPVVLVRACQATGRRADAEAVLAALDTAAQFGFVDVGELARGRVLFPHTLTRQAVLDLTSPSRRAALHARVGEVLQVIRGRLAPDGAAARLPLRPRGRPRVRRVRRKAAEYLTQAAREAERSLAFEDAAAWYAQAADLLDGTEAAREELWFSAAHSFLRAGDFAAARELYRKLCDSRDSQVRLRAAIGYEDAGWRPGLPGEDAAALLTRALDDVPADPGDPRCVWARASLGRAIAFTGDTGQARDLTWEALAQARELGEEQLLVHALEAMMWQAPGPESVDQYRELAAELARRAMASQNWDALGTAGVFQAGIAYIRADRAGWAEALAVLDRSVRGSGQPFVAYMRGCDDYAHRVPARRFRRCRAGRRGPGGARPVVRPGRHRGTLRAADVHGPPGDRRTGAGPAHGGRHPAVRGRLGAGLLALYTELGMTSEASALLAELLDWADEMPGGQSPWAQWTAVLVFLAEAAIALKDAAAARRLRRSSRPTSASSSSRGRSWRSSVPPTPTWPRLTRCWATAESAGLLFRRAVAQAREFGAPVHEAAALTAWAVHLSAGDASRPRGAARSGGCGDSGGPGSGLAAQVREQARRLAASTGQVRLQRRLRALGCRGTRGRPGRGRTHAAGAGGAETAGRGEQQPGDRFPAEDHARTRRLTTCAAFCSRPARQTGPRPPRWRCPGAGWMTRFPEAGSAASWPAVPSAGSPQPLPAARCCPSPSPRRRAAPHAWPPAGSHRG